MEKHTKEDVIKVVRDYCEEYFVKGKVLHPSWIMWETLNELNDTELEEAGLDIIDLAEIVLDEIDWWLSK
jgi:hypothetical protein